MLPSTPMIDERLVEDTAFRTPEVLGSPTVRWVARQMPVLGEKGEDRADLLGIDADGFVVIGEVKRGVVWPDALTQASRYVSAIQLGWSSGPWGASLGLSASTGPPGFRIALLGQLIEPSTRLAAEGADVPVSFGELIDELPGPRPRMPGHPKYTLWLSRGTAPAVIVSLLEGNPGITRDELVVLWQGAKSGGSGDEKTCRDNVDFWTGKAKGSPKFLGAFAEHAGPWTPIVSARYDVKEDDSGGLHLEWDPGWPGG